MTLTPRGNLAAFLENVIPSGEEGDRIKGIILRLTDEYAESYAASMIEQHARGPMRLRRHEKGEGPRERGKAS